MNKLIRNTPNILLSLIVTVILYTVTFSIILLFSGDGDEFNNPFMAFGAFLAMTFFIHFPIVLVALTFLIKKLKIRQDL
ncbi:hypothetical protein JOC78_002765 [Bacillus ectoiniformans]|uniref:hypothetical protein n=1 Tax=Bacillus ectoiniformans TaxID=1494429 RepID=UPI00195DAF9D|nr:hypothetical protein [Bacillus ectoiniformans]MBM7649781.1 hypothetical protein [Bacillus ectoiniformans]